MLTEQALSKLELKIQLLLLLELVLTANIGAMS
jgi:hypothetical protein